MKISVIVPVYKVEATLDRCLNSIVSQTFTDLEIILVDDGSPDSCPQMCEDWANRDCRIKVIHKQNEGLGLARNSGLEAATGDYVSFVDSDDFLDTGAYTQVMAKINKENPDVCYFSHYRLKADGSLVEFRYSFPETADDGAIQSALMPLSFGESLRKPFDAYVIGSSCMGVYRRGLLEEHSIRFKSERQFLCEDYLFTFDVCAKARRAAFVSTPLYYYCENQGSLTRSYRKDRFEKSESLYRHMVSLIQHHALDDSSLLRAKDCYLINIIVCLKQELAYAGNSLPLKIRNIRSICRSEITACVTKQYPVWQLPLKKMILLLALKYKMSRFLLFLTKMRLVKN